jgi:RimJ/RimL family protein N-acetyltransferase
MKRKAASGTISFRSIEDPDIEKIHGYQNGECREELSEMLEFDEPWAPMSKAQIKEKMDERRKERRSASFGVWSAEGNFVGVASFSSRWDPWCPGFDVVIWPEFRRKGFGRSAARKMLSIIFEEHLSNATSAYVPEWSDAARLFVASLGFKECGCMRRAGIKGGEYYDLLCYDMLKREYSKGHKEAL